MNRKRVLIRFQIALLGITLMAGCDHIKPLSVLTQTNTDTGYTSAAEASSSNASLSPMPSITSPAVSTKPQAIGTPAPASSAVQQASQSKFHPKDAAFNNENPYLMGIGIMDKLDKVVSLHGKPNNTFVMEDQDEAIKVYEYDTFSVGFDHASRVLFIDVVSDQAETGLNGLRIGQTLNDVVHALGKPDVNTSFVMSYTTKSAVLKLDIDPKTKTVQSIKLFGRN